MRRLWLLTVAIGLLAFPAAAGAQGAVTLTLTPPSAGKPTRLSLRATGSALNSGQEGPKTVTLFIARGFKIDPRARARRCTAKEAGTYSCPTASRVATGSARGVATAPPLGSFPFNATVEAFLSPKVRRGDIAGVVLQLSGNGRRASIVGRLVPVAGSGPFAAKLLFEDFDFGAQQAPPGSSARLDRFDLSVSARRRVRKVKIVKRRVRTRRGVRIRRRRKVSIKRYYLLRNPRTCVGSWPYQLRATFPTRPEVVRGGSVPCSTP